MSKVKQIEEIQNQINALKEELYGLQFDPVEAEIEEEIQYHKERLEEELTTLSYYEDEVRCAKQEVADAKSYIKKLNAQLASHKAKMAKKKKPKTRK